MQLPHYETLSTLFFYFLWLSVKKKKLLNLAKNDLSKIWTKPKTVQHQCNLQSQNNLVSTKPTVCAFFSSVVLSFDCHWQCGVNTHTHTHTYCVACPHSIINWKKMHSKISCLVAHDGLYALWCIFWYFLKWVILKNLCLWIKFSILLSLLKEKKKLLLI